MSISALERVITKSKSRGAARTVLMIIVWHLNERDQEKPAWPSIARIARLAGVHEQTVKAAIRHLEEIGELRVDRCAGPHGVHRYYLGPALLDGAGEITENAPESDAINSGGSPTLPQGVVLDYPGVVLRYPPLGSPTLPKPVNRNRTGKREPEGEAQKTNGVFSVPGAGAAVPPLAPLPQEKPSSFKNDEKQNDTTPKGETTMTTTNGFEGERPRSWAEALRVLLEATGIPEKDYLRSGKISTIARRWIDDEVSGDEARALAIQIANGGDDGRKAKMSLL